jgi:branched-chain amino acid transport system substrate-binding protein
MGPTGLFLRRGQRDHQRLKVSLASAADAKSARQPTVDAMASVAFDGATGKVAFDEFGDTTTKVLTTYKVEGGKFVPTRPKSSSNLHRLLLVRSSVM